ncbi:peter Pan-like protein isoform X2 [Phragmites australis]|uniref:peter Pan-like protein isoform X2 n=1 Tax=Phragmites australis TaxID=29695 RepID=UPI002D79DA8A|nr:peter Pan-like protein isoform X2 [Phragmites australis]
MRYPKSGPGNRRGRGPRLPAATPRKQQAATANVDQLTGAKIPKSFVFSRGKLPSTLRHLQQDLRKVMLPYTALNLKEKKRNNLKDFVNVAGPLGVTHFLILSNPRSLPHLRFVKSPQGPTYTFQIEEYALAADIANSQKRPRCPPGIFKNSPLVVLSGFTGHGEPFKSLVGYFQHMVPAIDPNTVKLATCQRILLLKYDKEKEVIDFRHYFIKLQPVGVSRRIRKLMQNNQVPDLRDLKDVSDYVTKAGYGSESEADEAATVSLASDVDKLNRASRKSAVRLQEIGPRMTMRLVKVELGLCAGDVLYPQYGKESGKKGKGTGEEIEGQEAEPEDGSEDEMEEE